MSLFEYRPYIDGLRAIAVSSVLLFHFHKNLLPGGFVGVDVFFVISGYLIASIIIGECENGQFSFLRFYQRRISRIFPAFFLVSLVTLIAASCLYTSQDFASAGAVMMAAALSVANLKLMLQGNYFELSPDAQPLLHFWSLSLEEQFYFVFPLIVYLAFRLKVTRHNLAFILIALAAMSFVGCIALTTKNPTWAFYLLPTRAWELLAGCILATYRPEQRSGNPRLEGILSNLGLLSIFISVVAINEGMPFPGFVAALPVFGTVLFLGYSKNRQSIAERWLSHPSLVLVGKMSYSLYLWHWPIFCFVDYALYTRSFIIRSILKICLTLVFSVVSYRWFENPIRSYLNKPKQRVFNFAIFAIGAISFVAIGFLISSNNYINASFDKVKDGGVAFNSTSSKPVVVLMGDSQGSMYGRTVKEIADEMGLRTHVLSVAAGDPLPNAQLYEDSLLFINRNNPEITIFAADWAKKIGNNRKRFEIALSALLEKSQHVIVIAQPPALPKYASRQHIRESGQQPIFEDVKSSQLRKETNTFLLSHRNRRVHVLDINSLFEKPDGSIRFTGSQGQQIYNDAGHLAGYGSNMAKQLIVSEISQILALPSDRGKVTASK
ncbi:acyltransferase family protein [Chamaesiphon sp. VAR_48_metabat_135_sub]|uniref:acyltransferase family protein n=1 Tax=Chamaesiphon sp. VAR_48_metabat_135_sub TaxID=2964699 RepID=UPI00286CFA3B|nr:acyltransferase family protein [Chamaesiphon sp. VAR_48_metabat_135_sub]